MKIRETITFTFEEIFMLIGKDPQSSSIGDFKYTGIYDSDPPKGKKSFTLVGKKELSWDDVICTINSELEKYGKFAANFTIQTSGSNFVCVGKETSPVVYDVKRSPQQVFLNSEISVLISNEGEIAKMDTSVRFLNVLKREAAGKSSFTIKDFLNLEKKPGNFTIVTWKELEILLQGKGLSIEDFPAKNWIK